MITLAFLLDHQVISRSDKNTVVAGSKNYVRARFILRTDDWARPITAIFGGYTQLLDDNNECTVPWEVLQQPGKVEVSAFCGDLHTANIAVVPVEKTGYKSGETPKDPTPDVYDQLAKMVQEAVDTANSVREDADAGNFDGEQGPAGPQGPKGDTGLGVPAPTQADAGKVPMVNEDGTGYVLREVSAGGGDAGQPGTDGEDGGYYTPSVDTAGNLSWTPSKVGMPSVPEANIRGPQGPQGDTGPAGPAGADGAQGPAGPQGETGPAGPEGPQGEQGPQGEKGDAGDTGPQGPKGEQGPAGPQGEQGPKGDQGDPGPQGPKGDTGETGPQGDTGATPQLTIGTVTTLDPDEDATVTITGTAEAPVLNFGIPKGEPGEDGSAGLPTPTAADAGKALAVKPDGTGYQLAGPYAPFSAAIRPTASGNPVNITDSVEWPLLGLKVYGKSTQASNQLLPLTETSYSVNGLTATLQEDGSLIVNGTPGSSFTNIIYIPLSLSPGDYYIAGGENTSGHAVAFIETKKNTGTGYWSNQSFSVDGTETSIIFMLQSNFANAINNYRVPAMLNKGTKPLPVQKYSGTPSLESPMPIVSAGDGGSIVLTVSDGADRSQQLTISTPTGLPGIPVDSGGNYTDAEGQQSACDVKDYGTGKYTQMVGHIESYNGESITTPYMSTTGQLSTGAEVYYVLDEPVVTDISTEELTAYRTLHTYDGTTVISTPEDVAGIEARYVANGEKYIDRKISEAIASAAETKLAAYDTLSGAIHEGVNEA